MCGKVGAGDGGADVADPGADAVGEDVVACAVVAAGSAVEYGSGGELVDVHVFPFAGGGVVDACGGGVGGRVVAALVVERVGVSSHSVLLLRSGGIAGCARPLGSLAFCESGDEFVDGG